MFTTVDGWLASRAQWQILALALCALGGIGFIDYATGYEISPALFYLVPVGMAGWYAGRRAGVALALLSCLVMYAADMGAGHFYSHPAIPIWNAVIRSSVLLITALLLTALRMRLTAERLQSRTDLLTGLLNSRAFMEKLEYTLALAGRNGNPLTLAYIDVDNFKGINDQYGHSEGDRVLRALGQAMTESTRRADTAARIGGDEFALLLTNMGSKGAAEAISKLTNRLQESLRAGGKAVTCSIGAVTFKKPPGNADQAMKAADTLMYEVKRKARNDVAFRVFEGSGAEAVLLSSPGGRPSRPDSTL
ncbi:MAG: GGDEF domain-containing protein [Acidobacteriota bacterium]|nr:GGDEF domain-containing protein [Acidobacteriota bacterium]